MASAYLNEFGFGGGRGGGGPAVALVGAASPLTEDSIDGVSECRFDGEEGEGDGEEAPEEDGEGEEEEERDVAVVWSLGINK